MQKLRTKDPVQVIAWKFKWTVSVISKRDQDNVYLEWVNMITRHKKWWNIIVHTPINVSNVMYYSDADKSCAKVSINEWKRTLKKFNHTI